MKEFFKNRQKIITIVITVFAVIALILPFALARPATATLRFGQQTYALNIVTSKVAQERGLGDRESIARDRGMLFVFDTAAVQCFWMKDMRFPIDIIWLNSAKKVTYVAANVAPDTYPQKFCGDASTKYVVELNAGEAMHAGIRVGQQVSL